MATNWPLHAAEMRSALDYAPDQGDEVELEEYMAAVCERIDRETGRHVDATRHEVGGKVPAEWIIWAKALGKLRWQQAKQGPRARPDDESAAVGFDLPRWIESGLAKYPPPLFVAAES